MKKSFNHRITTDPYGGYILRWAVVPKNYLGEDKAYRVMVSRPGASREGAERFAKRWGVLMPEDEAWS